MKWTSIEQVVAELRLDADVDDLEAIGRQLRARLADVHPDKSGGDFASAKQEDEFHQLKTACDFIKQAENESKTLIPITQLPSIIRAFQAVQVPKNTETSHDMRMECRSALSDEIRSKYAVPKIGAGLFGSLCVSLFMFSSKLADHPLLGQLAKNTHVQMGLLMLSAYAGMFFLVTWLHEQREKAHMDWLMSENGRRSLFEALVREHDFDNEGSPLRVSVHQIADRIARERHQSFTVLLLPFLRNTALSGPVAEKIARSHLLELEERGAVHRVKTPNWDLIYEFEPQALIGLRGR